MVKSKFCNLIGIESEDLYRLEEDPYDIGGYFIIIEVERILIGQERMLNNHVFVTKNNPNINDYIVEMRSITACQNKPSSIMKVHMMLGGGV